MKFGQAVYDHAIKNYNKSGWDFVVECWEIGEIDEETKNCRTLNGAIKKMKSIVSLQDEMRNNQKDW